MRTSVAIAATLALGTALFGGVMLATTPADAVTQVTVNRYIRDHGGIPPCKWEDGSGQPGPCVWMDYRDGEMEGWNVLNVPNGQDKRPILFLSR